MHDRAGSHGSHLDGARFEAPAATSGAIRLCQHVLDGRAAREQRVQRRDGKLGCAGEYDTWVGAHAASIPLGELR